MTSISGVPEVDHLAAAELLQSRQGRGEEGIDLRVVRAEADAVEKEHHDIRAAAHSYLGGETSAFAHAFSMTSIFSANAPSSASSNDLPDFNCAKTL
jgi:hypothetical protein